MPVAAACADERPQSARDPALAPDHLADVLLGDVQPEDDRAVPLGPLHAHLVRPVDEVPRQVLEQLLQAAIRS